MVGTPLLPLGVRRVRLAPTRAPCAHQRPCTVRRAHWQVRIPGWERGHPKHTDYAVIKHSVDNADKFCPFEVKECMRPGVKGRRVVSVKGQGHPCCSGKDTSCCRLRKNYKAEAEPITQEQWWACPPRTPFLPCVVVRPYVPPLRGLPTGLAPCKAYAACGAVPLWRQSLTARTPNETLTPRHVQWHRTHETLRVGCGSRERLPSVPKGHWGSCAYVALGDNLLRSERGAEIDAHDVVMRLGHAPVKGYEKHVGSRTGALPRHPVPVPTPQKEVNWIRHEPYCTLVGMAY